MFLSLFVETITSLISQLDDEKNNNLFELVKFLKLYYLSNTVENQLAYKNVINSYGKLVEKINKDTENHKKRVQEKLGSSLQESHLQDKTFQYIQMINNFNSLPNFQQKNVLNLGLFILYCKIHKLDDPQIYHLWRRYSQLIEQIKCLPINEQI